MAKINAKTVAELLKEIRERSGYSIEQLAEKSGKSIDTIKRLETLGVYGFDILNDIFETLDVDVQMLVIPKGNNDKNLK